MDSLEPIDVPCTDCGAEPGMPCWWSDIESHSDDCHYQRQFLCRKTVEAAKALHDAFFGPDADYPERDKRR